MASNSTDMSMRSTTVEKPSPKRLMENVHPDVLSGTKPRTRPEGVGTEPEQSAGKEITGNEAYIEVRHSDEGRG